MNPYSALESQAANAYGLNPAVFQALGTVESGQTPGALSAAGAQGLYQIMPFNDAGTGTTNPYSPYQSAQAGAQILARDLTTAGGNYAKAIQYYNCGPGQTCPAGIAEANKVLGLSGLQNTTAKTTTPSSSGNNTLLSSTVGFSVENIVIILLGILTIGAGVWALAKG